MTFALALCAAAARTLTAWAAPSLLAPGTPTPPAPTPLEAAAARAAASNDAAAPLVNHVAAASYVGWPTWDPTGWPQPRPSHLPASELQAAHQRHVAAVLADEYEGQQAVYVGDIDGVQPSDIGVAVA